SAYIFASCEESRMFSSRVYDTMRDIQLRSAPAQKFAPSLRSTTARSLVLASMAPKTSIALAISSSLNALWTSGRLSVTVRMSFSSPTISVRYGMRERLYVRGVGGGRWAVGGGFDLASAHRPPSTRYGRV